MRRSSLARGLATVIALMAFSAGPCAAAWPNADPAQPLIQAQRLCASGVVPINRRCHVVDFAKIGAFAGRDWYYAFYATHWADRHGRLDRGFPVIFYLERPATLRLSLWIDDSPGLTGHWAHTPPPRPVLVERPGASYLGFSLQNLHGADDQRLFRLDGRHWRSVNVLRRSNADEALISQTTPADCSPVDDGLYDWNAFQLKIPLRKDSGQSCGVVVADLKPHHNHLDLTKAVLAR